MSDIRIFKLTSGEEIMGSLEVTDAESFRISDTVALVYQQAGDGRMTVGFAPFMPYGEESTTVLYRRAVAASATPKEQILGEYNRVFSKIVIAPAGSF
jgi:hypothetical protein